jgi:hypothetical protein
MICGYVFIGIAGFSFTPTNLSLNQHMMHLAHTSLSALINKDEAPAYHPRSQSIRGQPNTHSDTPHHTTKHTYLLPSLSTAGMFATVAVLAVCARRCCLAFFPTLLSVGIPPSTCRSDGTGWAPPANHTGKQCVDLL